METLDPKKLTGVSRELFERIEFDKNESLLCEVRKHQFGLFLRYITGSVIIIIFSVIFFILPFVSEDVGSFAALSILIGLLLVILSIAATLLSAYLYSSNVFLVTTDKIAQVLNKSIFSRKISQLSIGDVQDVTVLQSGFFPRIFNYGTIVIETAGEQSNLIFTFTPDPYKKSKAIVGAHEENLKKYGN